MTLCHDACNLGTAVWCLASGVTNEVEYHIDYAELYRYVQIRVYMNARIQTQFAFIYRSYYSPKMDTYIIICIFDFGAIGTRRGSFSRLYTAAQCT
jgi:hypothetical protein